MQVEVKNWQLLYGTVVVCIVNILMPHLAKYIVSWFYSPTKEELLKLEELRKLLEELNQKSIKDEFAAYSRLQRRINKLEAEVKKMSQSRISASVTVNASIKLALEVLVAIVTVISIIFFRKIPVATMKGDLFPFTTVLRYPSELPNAISAHVWIIISNVTLKVLLKPMLP